ncbi:MULTISPECIES: trimeric porin PorB [Neisseria]|uniref:Gram-negative porin family protein n=1 Tax=Neisseria musculi TaxID=1815583 RepID=A0A7H1MDC8_9NEIS|nr:MULTISPECIES: trimeric porin PorB [Neisseria]MBF0803620.1 porin [Neisseria sp. 19428wB4_WF04]QNT59643.1 gram-negative porin family protein [Neisseria musculi]TFU43701.1 porin [Neisseria sp. WF04]
MKKSLIALSLAALPAAAFADVTLYGQIKAGVEVSQNQVKVNGVTTKDHTTTEIADFGSRIGFKGHEHLGNNLNAIWQVEQKTPVAGGGQWGTRDSFIGLEGGFGKIRAGRISTQLNDMDAIDPWEYNNSALGLGVFTRTGTREVSARYDTPVFGGFSANVQFTPRDNQTEGKVRGTTDATGRTSNASDTSAYYAGLNYENSGFFAQYGGGFKKTAYVANGSSKSGQAHQVQVGYDANNLFAGLGYQYTNGWDSENSYKDAIYNVNAYDAAAAAADTSAGVKTQELAATVAYRFGNVTPRLSYAQGFKAKAKNNGQERKLDGTQYKQVVLGADYDFSKRTTAMVSAGWLKAGSGDNKADTTAGLVGLRHKF